MPRIRSTRRSRSRSAVCVHPLVGKHAMFLDGVMRAAWRPALALCSHLLVGRPAMSVEGALLASPLGSPRRLAQRRSEPSPVACRKSVAQLRQRWTSV